MEKNPYTFDASNKRLVMNVEKPNTVFMAAGALFLGSLHLYNRKFLRVDGKAGNALLFAVLSAPASYTYANFFLSDATTEAGALNNEREHSS